MHCLSLSSERNALVMQLKDYIYVESDNLFPSPGGNSALMKIMNDLIRPKLRVSLPCTILTACPQHFGSL